MTTIIFSYLWLFTTAVRAHRLANNMECIVQIMSWRKWKCQAVFLPALPYHRISDELENRWQNWTTVLAIASYPHYLSIAPQCSNQPQTFYCCTRKIVPSQLCFSLSWTEDKLGHIGQTGSDSSTAAKLQKQKSKESFSHEGSTFQIH